MLPHKWGFETLLFYIPPVTELRMWGRCLPLPSNSCHDAASLSRRPSYVQICQREFGDLRLTNSGLLWLFEAAHAYQSRHACLTDGVNAHRCPFPETSALTMFTEAVGASPAGKGMGSWVIETYLGVNQSINDLHINVIAIIQGRPWRMILLVS